MTQHTQRFVLLAGLALTATLFAAPAAQAFTFERNAAGDNGAALNYTDPMQNLAPKSDGGANFDGHGHRTIYQQDGLTLQMNSANGGTSFDQRYDPSNLFDPFARDGH